MRTVNVFNSVTLDGYFTGENGDLRWAHGGEDPEWKAFVESNAQGDGSLVFGRVTYEMMAGYWPTAQAAASDPVVAKQMNALPKLVFSRTLRQATWNNTTLLSGNPAEEIRRLKQESGGGLTILGSGTIVAQLARAGLVDHYSLVLTPVVLGKGRTMFEGVPEPLGLKLLTTRTFRNGRVLLTYEPVTQPKPRQEAPVEAASSGRKS